MSDGSCSPSSDYNGTNLQKFTFGSPCQVGGRDIRAVSPTNKSYKVDSCFDDDSSDEEDLADIVSELTIADSQVLPDVEVTERDPPIIEEIISVSHDICKSITNDFEQRHVINGITQYITIRDLSIMAACVVLGLRDFNSSIETYISLNPIYSPGNLTLSLWHFSATDQNMDSLIEYVNIYLDTVEKERILKLRGIDIERYVSHWNANDGDVVARMRTFSEGKMMFGWKNSVYNIWY